MTKSLSLALIGVGFLLAAIAVGYFTSIAQASAPSGLPATVATSSTKSVVAATVQTLIATSTNCASRIITTRGGGGIRLVFSDYRGEVPSDVLGAFQAGSTTIAYDGGIYGCNAFKVFPYDTNTIDVVETR